MNRKNQLDDMYESHLRAQEELQIDRVIAKKQAVDAISSNSFVAFKHQHEKVANLNAMMDINEMKGNKNAQVQDLKHKIAGFKAAANEDDDFKSNMHKIHDISIGYARFQVDRMKKESEELYEKK